MIKEYYFAGMPYDLNSNIKSNLPVNELEGEFRIINIQRSGTAPPYGYLVFLEYGDDEEL